MFSRRGLAALSIGMGAATKVQAQVPEPATPAYRVSDAANLPYRPIPVRAPDGVRLVAQEWGNPSGPAILFVHGVLQSHLSFAKQVRGPLVRDFRIVTFDLRGHGASDKPPGAEAYLDGRIWADDVKAVMEAAGLRRPVLSGWSLGGVVMANYLKAHGDGALAGLHFVDVLVKRAAEFGGRPENRSLLPASASVDLSTRIEGLRGFLRSCFEVQPSTEEFERMLAAQAEVPQPILAHILRGIPLDAEDALRAVRVPTLITHGALDGQISPRMSDFTKSLIPHARHSIYEGIGHAPFYEAPERFDAELADLVREANRP
jgi:pimeloyl-ACP methyl ester carboxylesterase